MNIENLTPDLKAKFEAILKEAGLPPHILTLLNKIGIADGGNRISDRIDYALLQAYELDREWISVYKILPQENERVLFMDEDEGIVDVGYYNGYSFDHCLRVVNNEFQVTTSYSVTHWQPLPKPLIK